MKTFDLFDTIWDNVVIPICKDYLNKYKLTDYTKRVKRIAKKWFNTESQIFVQSYMVNETRNIDRHKIASCMVKAILIAKPLRVPFSEKIKQLFGKAKIDEVACLINQYLAINVAIVILDGYISSDSKKELKHIIHLPEPFPAGQKNYVKDVCLGLYYTSPKKIHTITYANIFFLWEKYSCRRVQCFNLENKCRELLVKYYKMEGRSCDPEEIEKDLHKVRMQSERS